MISPRDPANKKRLPGCNLGPEGMIYMFWNFHRLSADAYKYAELEVLEGVAALMAEYNRIERSPHVVEKLIWLTTYTEGTEALGPAACENCINEPDSELVYPN